MKYDKYMAMSSCTVFMPDNASGQILPHSSPARKKADEPVQERSLTVHSFDRSGKAVQISLIFFNVGYCYFCANINEKLETRTRPDEGGA